MRIIYKEKTKDNNFILGYGSMKPFFILLHFFFHFKVRKEKGLNGTDRIIKMRSDRIDRIKKRLYKIDWIKKGSDRIDWIKKALPMLQVIKTLKHPKSRNYIILSTPKEESP